MNALVLSLCFFIFYNFQQWLDSETVISYNTFCCVPSVSDTWAWNHAAGVLQQWNESICHSQRHNRHLSNRVVILPEASVGLHVMSLLVSVCLYVSVCLSVSMYRCVRVCVNFEHVHMITHHPMKSEPSNSDERCKIRIRDAKQLG